MAAIQRIDDRSWDVGLDNGANPAVIDEEGIAPSAHMPTQTRALDKDIVLYWRLVRDLPGSVDLITHKPDADGRGTFLLTFMMG